MLYNKGSNAIRVSATLQNKSPCHPSPFPSYRPVPARHASSKVSPSSSESVNNHKLVHSSENIPGHIPALGPVSATGGGPAQHVVGAAPSVRAPRAVIRPASRGSSPTSPTRLLPGGRLLSIESVARASRGALCPIWLCRARHAVAAAPVTAAVAVMEGRAARLSALGSRLSTRDSWLSAPDSQPQTLGSRLSALGSRLSDSYEIIRHVPTSPFNVTLRYPRVSLKPREHGLN